MNALPRVALRATLCLLAVWLGASSALTAAELSRVLWLQQPLW